MFTQATEVSSSSLAEIRYESTAKPISAWRCPGDRCWFGSRCGRWPNQQEDRGFVCRVGEKNQYLSMYLCICVCMYHLSPSALALNREAHWPNGPLATRARASEPAALRCQQREMGQLACPTTPGAPGASCPGFLTPPAAPFLPRAPISTGLSVTHH